MKHIYLLFLFFLPSSYSSVSAQSGWKDIAVTEDLEIFVDTTSIKPVDGRIYATTKTVYTTEHAKTAYINKIRKAYVNDKKAAQKIAKWNNFSYNITYGVYDCANKRFKIMEVHDFGSDDSLIIKTKKKESKSIWLSVDTDTVGDYVLFDICDFESR